MGGFFFIDGRNVMKSSRLRGWFKRFTRRALQFFFLIFLIFGLTGAGPGPLATAEAVPVSEFSVPKDDIYYLWFKAHLTAGKHRLILQPVGDTMAGSIRALVVTDNANDMPATPPQEAVEQCVQRCLYRWAAVDAPDLAGYRVRVREASAPTYTRSEAVGLTATPPQPSVDLFQEFTLTNGDYYVVAVAVSASGKMSKPAPERRFSVARAASIATPPAPAAAFVEGS